MLRQYLWMLIITSSWINQFNILGTRLKYQNFVFEIYFWLFNILSEILHIYQSNLYAWTLILLSLE